MKAHELAYANTACFTMGTSVREAAQWMADHDRDAIAVIENEITRSPAGVVTARNILEHLAVVSNTQDSLVDEVMTRDPMLIDSETDIENVARSMQKANVRCACVVSASGACSGMVTLEDVVLGLALTDVTDVLPDEAGAELLKQVGRHHRREREENRHRKDRDAMLDEALRETFPASDPIAVTAETPKSRKRRRRT